MDGGIIGDAMVDMTGGVSEHINNDKLDVNLLKKYFALETLLGAGCMQVNFQINKFNRLVLYRFVQAVLGNDNG